MKAIEIKHIAITKELAKLVERLEKAQTNLTKKIAKAEKLGVANMSNEEHREWLATVPTDNGWIINKEDIKKNGAWFDMISAGNRIEELEGQIENAEKRLAQAEEKVEAYRAEVEAIEDLKQKELLWAEEFEAEQKEWAKDGIKLEGRYHGTTPSGKRFVIYGNSGYTRRSLHCFTLRIAGETIFTSGEFWRAYGVIRNN